MSQREAEHPLLDEKTVDTLKRIPGDGVDVFTEFVGLFLDNATTRMEALLLALERGDLEMLADESHALKSSSANIGALDFSQQCRVLERRAMNEELDAIREQIAEFSSSFSETCEALVQAKS